MQITKINGNMPVSRIKPQIKTKQNEKVYGDSISKAMTRDSVSFTGFGCPEMDAETFLKGYNSKDKKNYISNVTIKGDLKESHIECEELNLKDNVKIKGDFKLYYNHGRLEVGNNFSAKSVFVVTAIFGKNTTIENEIETNNGITALDDFSAGSVQSNDKHWGENQHADYSHSFGNRTKINEGVKIYGKMKALDDFSAESLEAKEVKLGNRATIRGNVETSSMFEALDDFSAQKVSSYKGDIILGKNVHVEKIVSGGDLINIGSIKKVEEFEFVYSKDQSLSKTIKIGEDIPASVSKKIKVLLSDKLKSLTLETPTGDKNILERFEFFEKTIVENAKKKSEEVLTKIDINNPGIIVKKIAETAKKIV